ncbi:LysR family transcriptional regulator [Roseovarius sp. EL26]|uniref:LysR family transcriptional regulator n=1 Tax=Roseovarius sp. EL26 TaxID=2126672 RepID=UPI000EA2BF1F|nr:LysR family transcriptional regulator [Roseovarius sp. EL26]
MDTAGLKLFVMAAELLNISEAGRRLGLAPAVASARLAKLENQLGADLLHRSTRKVSLSIEGAEFLPYAKEILSQEKAALAALGHGSADVTGTLRFAASSTFAQLFIAPLLPEFLDRYPGINLELKFSDTQMNLIDGSFDLALRIYAIEDSSLKARKLSDDPRILCASPTYLARYGTPSTPEDLTNHQTLTFISNEPRKLSKMGDPHDYSFPPSDSDSRVTCDDGASMRLATVAGAGISMNSMWSVYRELQNGSLVQILPDYEIKDSSAIWLVYPKSNVLTSKVRVFIDYLVEKIGNPPAWLR